MIFTVQVANKDNQQSEEPFIRYYAGQPAGKKARRQKPLPCGILCGRPSLSVVSSAADSQAME